MDHLDLPRGRIVDRQINYSVPRICHVSKHDFQFAAIADLHRQHYKFATFGILPVCCLLYLFALCSLCLPHTISESRFFHSYFSAIIQFRDRTPYTDNPTVETEVAEDDHHILRKSKDQVLLGKWELIEVQEERIDEVVQEIQPEILGFAEASTDRSPFGRTDVGSKQGSTEETSIEYFNISMGSMMIPHNY